MIVTRVPGTFTEPSPVRVHHSTGVDDLVLSRWTPQEIYAADGEQSEWRDYRDDALLAGFAPTNRPTVDTLGDGSKFLAFDATNDYLTTTLGATPAGIALVCKTRNTNNGYIFSGGSGGLRLATTGTHMWAGGTVGVAGTAVDTWRCVQVQKEGDDLRLTVDGATATGSLPSVLFGTNLLVGSVASGNYPALDILECFTFSEALDSTERAAVRSAMQDRYSVLT